MGICSKIFYPRMSGLDYYIMCCTYAEIVNVEHLNMLLQKYMCVTSTFINVFYKYCSTDTVF